MSVNDWVAVLGIALAAFGGLQALVSLIRLNRAKRRSRRALEAADAVYEDAPYLGVLPVDKSSQAVLAQRVATIQRQAELEPESTIPAGNLGNLAELMGAVVEEKLTQADKRARWKDFWNNLAFFVAGVVVSVLITLFVPPIGG